MNSLKIFYRPQDEQRIINKLTEYGETVNWESDNGVIITLAQLENLAGTGLQIFNNRELAGEPADLDFACYLFRELGWRENNN